jgi:hypothetical protein
MGMFDIIHAKLKCPKTKESKEREIQIKWRELRLLEPFKVGDKIKDIFSEYNNTWVRADYLCNSCSKKTKGKYGPFIKTEDQKWHYCFVKMEKNAIKSVLNEKDFKKQGIENYVIYD